MYGVHRGSGFGLLRNGACPWKVCSWVGLMEGALNATPLSNFCIVRIQHAKGKDPCKEGTAGNTLPELKGDSNQKGNLPSCHSGDSFSMTIETDINTRIGSPL